MPRQALQADPPGSHSEKRRPSLLPASPSSAAGCAPLGYSGYHHLALGPGGEDGVKINVVLEVRENLGEPDSVHAAQQVLDFAGAAYDELRHCLVKSGWPSLSLSGLGMHAPKACTSSKPVWRFGLLS